MQLQLSDEIKARFREELAIIARYINRRLANDRHVAHRLPIPTHDIAEALLDGVLLSKLINKAVPVSTTNTAPLRAD